MLRVQAPPESGAALRLRLLGALDIDGVDRGRLGSRKARLLLARLALGRGRPVAVGELAEAVWPHGGAPARPADQIAVLVSRIRAVIGTDRITRISGGYALRLDWLDVDAAADLVAEARRRLAAGTLAPARAAADAARALHRGPLLAEEPDAPWLEAERAAAARTAGQAHQIAAEIALAGGDPWAAVEHAERVLHAEPYHEGALRALMTALVQSGRPARALAVFAQFADRLRDELGVDPQPETKRLHLSLLRGDAGSAAPAPVRVRLPGRDLQLAMLAAALTDAAAGRAVRVRVDGVAGIGKTRLLDTFAQTLPDRVVALRACGSELGRRLPLQPLLDALADHLRRRDAAAVADLLDGPAALLADLLTPATEAPGRMYGGGMLASVTDAGTGQALLLHALDTVLARLAAGGPVALLVDDAHWLDAASVTWLGRVTTRLADAPLLVVLACRVEEGVALPADRTVPLGPLDLAAVTSIVGPDRAAELLARSGGHPLFLIELRDAGATTGLPESIRAAVAERCDRAGAAGATLRAAAVLGSDVDLELLAAVLEEPPTVLLDHLEEGVRRHLLVEQETGFGFRHQLIQDALRAGTGAGRRALLHRQAARCLAARGEKADPLVVAHHARAGGDQGLAAVALANAGEAAAARFDHDEALRHLTAAVDLDDSPALRIRRARAELQAGRFAEAAADAQRALAVEPSAEALEVAGIAAYVLRDLQRCRRLAEQAVRLATDPAVASSCYALAGRAAHVTGDLAGADTLLRRAREIAAPATAALTSIWSAPLLVDQGQAARALELLAEPNLVRIQRHPFMLPHRHLSAAQAHASLGDVVAALADLDAVDASAAGQRTPRFAARADNMRAFILRNLGAADEADARNTAAYQVALDQVGMGEPVADALLGLADGRLRAGDLDAAERLLERVDHEAPSPRVFQWRHELRRRLLAGRLALARGQDGAALAHAQAVLAAAAALPLPRYVTLARVLAAAAAPAGDDAEDAVEDIDALDQVAPLEAWWLTDLVARRYGSAALRALASRRRAWIADQARRAGLTAGRSAPASAPASPTPP